MAPGNLRLAAALLGTAGLVHLAVWMIGGTSAELGAGVAALGVAAGLWRGWRWLGWMAMLGLIVAVGLTLARVGSSAVPDLLLFALVAVDAVAIMSLFLSSWRSV